jgi:hypothetical protein
MKKKAFLATIIGLILVVSLTACGTKTIIVEKTSDTVEEPVIEDTETTGIGEQVYVDTVADEYPEVMKEMGKKWVIEFGYLVCDAIDGGMTFDDLLGMTVKTGADATQIGFLTGAAITTLCPENKWFIETLN